MARLVVVLWRFWWWGFRSGMILMIMAMAVAMAVAMVMTIIVVVLAHPGRRLLGRGTRWWCSGRWLGFAAAKRG